MAATIKTTSGSFKRIDEGESAIITASFYDADNVQIPKSAFTSLEVTLYNKSDGAVINTRENQDIIDANGGYLTDVGVLTLKLGPLDNIIIDADCQEEDHIVRLKWTWVDADLDTLTVIKEWKITVRNLTTPVA